MCAIENKKIILAVFKLMFKEIWIGNAICSYEYETVREDFKNMLKIELNTTNPLKKTKNPIYKTIECEIECFIDSSQALNLIQGYLNVFLLGAKVTLDRIIYDFNFTTHKDYQIRMTLNGPNMIPYEITNLKDGKYLILSEMTDEEAISYAYENILQINN